MMIARRCLGSSPIDLSEAEWPRCVLNCRLPRRKRKVRICVSRKCVCHVRASGRTAIFCSQKPSKKAKQDNVLQIETLSLFSRLGPDVVKTGVSRSSPEYERQGQSPANRCGATRRAIRCARTKANERKPFADRVASGADLPGDVLGGRHIKPKQYPKLHQPHDHALSVGGIQTHRLKFSQK